MNAFIIMYNHLSWPREMARFLTKAGLNVIMIDNASTYEPLLEWYEKGCPYEVYKMEENMGHLVYWKSRLFSKYTDRYFVVTDNDLDLSELPKDFMDVLMKGLVENPSVTKSGLSLMINDLPNNAYAKQVFEWERKFWDNKDAYGYYHGAIDTTFALYDRDRVFGELPGLSDPSNDKFFSAVRSPEPYVIRHCPWYLTPDFLKISEEERYFQAHTTGYWSEKFKATWKL